jgi:hypothetical protein
MRLKKKSKNSKIGQFLTILATFLLSKNHVLKKVGRARAGAVTYFQFDVF